MIILDADINEIKKEIIKLTNGKRVFICGVAAMGRAMSEWMKKNEMGYYAFVDKKGSAYWTEEKVYVYEEIEKIKSENDIFIITQSYQKKEVKDDLDRIGVPEDSIITFASRSVFDNVFYDLKKDISKRKMITESFKNLHKGERCFIIGNGPSLKMSDLLKLSGEATFTVNSMYKCFSELTYKPTYYMVTDRAFASDFERNEDEFRFLLNHVKTAFFEMKTTVFDKYAESDYENLFFFKSTEIDPRNGNNEYPFFSDDIVREVYRSGTVIFATLQFACYMGFKEIYLLGIDLTFKNEEYGNGSRKTNGIERNHAAFIPEPEWYNDTTYELIDTMLYGFVSAKKYADKNGIRILNATRGGKLEVFDRVDFDSLF